MAARLSAAVRFGWSFTLFVFVEVSEAALIRRGLDLTMGSHRSFHRQALSAVAVVPVAPGREEGRRMRMQSIVFPPIVVLVGYSSICCPGQSSVSGKPVASQTASKFVAFNGSDLGTFSK